jgi:hypothetical protein
MMLFVTTTAYLQASGSSMVAARTNISMIIPAHKNFKVTVNKIQ